ncbi:hypothetical protein ES332_A05G318900v1 [Gossypium tomentosum]|uniref:Retrotransposon gag domain-containing protein n=1 Tax=Gossypium tomentosum TaxID=34277 RepID=A0A5D2QMU9_GOSTO|nr:hypothetical protein ES332_A05G318900v1 [Gossypium tomentosum]
MTTNTISLEEQVASLTKIVESIIASLRQRDKQINFMMKRIIDLTQKSLRMSPNCQPSKFQQFDGKGNPRQHVAHFMETCNNQFVRTLKENALGWYTDLEPRIIDSWEQHEHYIHHWRNLSLNWKERLSKSLALNICIQGMNWGLCYFLQGIKPKSFEGLTIQVHDKELSMMIAGNLEPLVQDLKKEKKYLFPDFDVASMLEELLKNKLIQLPKMKPLKKADKLDNPNYCKYHRLISHSQNHILKGLIIRGCLKIINL